MGRQLTRQERIEARHLLQELSEQARSVRNALDPVSGVLNITEHVWDEQWHALKRHLDSYTQRVLAGESSAGGVGDRNV